MVAREPCRDPLLWCLVVIPHLLREERPPPCATCRAYLARGKENP
jgi:hypothetical protein